MPTSSLRKLLLYAKHKPDCNRQTVKYGPNNLMYNGPCTCGLVELLKEMRDADSTT